MSAAKLLMNGQWTTQWLTDERGLSYRELTLALPVRTVSETNQREHWAARHRRRRSQRADVGLCVGVMLRQECMAIPCVVTMTRIAPSSGLDDDNLRSSLKAVRDGIADALRVDDRSSMVEWRYDQRRGGRREYGVVIVVGPRRESA